MRLANPGYLLFLLIIPLYWFLKYGGKSKLLSLTPTLLYSSTDIFPKKRTRAARIFNRVSDLLISIAILFLILAMARPQGGQDITPETSYGIDIVLAIDVSGSMLYIDSIPSTLPRQTFMGNTFYSDPKKDLFEFNRLNSAKKVIREYIESQEFNRIGVVVFGGYSYTKCPLTLDYDMLSTIVDDVEYNADNDGTAIGMGIATSINRLKKSEAVSKVIILLTDGVNNSGMIDPIPAANIARDMDIRIYTIGLGNPEGSLAPANVDFTQYYLSMENGYDSDTLEEIANITGGAYYEADNPDALEDIYSDIDQLEKSKFEIQRRVMYTENFMPFLIAGILFLATYIIATHFIIKIP